jgi:hypothetical protein
MIVVCFRTTIESVHYGDYTGAAAVWYRQLLSCAYSCSHSNLSALTDHEWDAVTITQMRYGQCTSHVLMLSVDPKATRSAQLSI